MSLQPTQQSVFLLSGEKGEPMAMIKDRKLYSLSLLDDDGVAKLFNGNDTLPLVPSALGKKLP